MNRPRFSLFEKRHQRDGQPDANRASDERLAVLKIRTTDVILIVILFMVGFIMLPAVNPLANRHHRTTGKLEIVVVVSGNVVFRHVYDPSDEPVNFHWDENGHSMTIQVGPEGARVLSSDCRDQFCVHSRPISMPGQAIVCAPNQMIVKVIGSSDDGAADFVEVNGPSADVDAVAGQIGGYDAP